MSKGTGCSHPVVAAMYDPATKIAEHDRDMVDVLTVTDDGLEVLEPKGIERRSPSCSRRATTRRLAGSRLTTSDADRPLVFHLTLCNTGAWRKGKRCTRSGPLRDGFRRYSTPHASKTTSYRHYREDFAGISLQSERGYNRLVDPVEVVFVDATERAGDPTLDINRPYLIGGYV